MLRNCVQMVNPARLQALEAWRNENHISLSQVNGQRRYGGPPDGWEGPAPGDGCEVFISQLPEDVFEDLLIPLFSSVGRLWEFRLMMNFSGWNRGFAYATYGSAGEAAAAVRRLHGHRLGPARQLGVCLSTQKKQLCVGELPVTSEQPYVLQVLRALSGGVESVSLKSGKDIKGVSALVVYESHHAAAMAKKVIREGFKKHCSLTVSVRWHYSSTKVRRPLPHGEGPPRSQNPRLQPPRLQPPLPTTETFNKAPGAPGPLPPRPAPSWSSPLPQKPCLVALLQRTCGTRLDFNLECTTSGPWHVCVSYSVQLPHLPQPLKGWLTVRRGVTHEDTWREVNQLVAGRALAALWPGTEGVPKQAW
ncbi:dead end protein 1 isoform X1 [Gadus macrocephalus]|uniref:dead end protein 1 isoform X1 n=2 Tax=Gadus macrocephalus TaxID=80720 RepID=UPI0028CB9688|nr:dead end protein 1 isoform X1 [Gadus macrocephalus]